MDVSSLFSFLKNSPTAYHAVKSAAAELTAKGFLPLSMTDEWKLADGGKYFVTFWGTALVAFVYKKDAPFMISATHGDSPTYRLRTGGGKTAAGEYAALDVEPYGGMIHYTWFDKPLSVAGRAYVKDADGIIPVPVKIERDLAVIPSVAIHQNREVNKNFAVNPAVDILPVFALEKTDFLDLLADELGTARENILSHDLFLYVREEGRTVGQNGELILAPRLDDLASVYACLSAFLAAEEGDATRVFALFDNEEVGSDTKQGAASTLLYDVLTRIAGEKLSRLLPRSFMVSADNGHAKHPAHPELSDATYAPKMGSGVVIKYQAGQKYATDGYADAVFRTLCERAEVPYQYFNNRADLPGGSTLGSISDTRVALPTVDIGLPQWAMHAAVETASAADYFGMVRVMTAFFESRISLTGDKIALVPKK